MKITSFNPLIVSKDSQEIIEVFEALGFERRHLSEDIEQRDDLSSIRMKDANGFHVDIAQANVPQDKTIIRMNVSDFDEGYQFLTERGFTHPSGRIIEDKSSKSAMIVSPSGFAFDLCQHIKDHD